MSSDVILATAPARVTANAVTAQTLMAGNAHRRGLVLFNDSVGYLYVKYGSGATSTDFTFKLSPGDIRELDTRYVGIVTGIWSAAVAGEACQATELV